MASWLLIIRHLARHRYTKRGYLRVTRIGFHGRPALLTLLPRTHTVPWPTRGALAAMARSSLGGRRSSLQSRHRQGGRAQGACHPAGCNVSFRQPGVCKGAVLTTLSGIYPYRAASVACSRNHRCLLNRSAGNPGSRRSCICRFHTGSTRLENRQGPSLWLFLRSRGEALRRL